MDPGSQNGTVARRLRVWVLGRARVSYGATEIKIANRKYAALLAYLALSDKGSETRERLIGLLWSEADTERARGSLRQAIYDLRLSLSAAGFHGLSAAKHSVTLDRSKVDVDLDGILAEARSGRAHELLSEQLTSTDEMLKDFEAIDPGYQTWLTAKRRALHDRLVHLLEGAIDEHIRPSREMSSVARALLNLDGTHEVAARTLIRARVAAGDVGGALAIYRQLWELLEEDYDTEPSRETQALIAQVKLDQPLDGEDPTKPPDADETVEARARTASELTAFGPSMPALPAVEAAPTVRPAGGREKLIVSIGRFEVAGASQDKAYLFQGFRRELIGQLVRFREWLVRDLAHGQGSVQADATEYIIEGSAVQQGDAARLIMTLQDARTGDYLWSERLPIDLAAWYESQQEVVRRLASKLNVYLSAGRLSSVIGHANTDLSAYDRWLKAQTKLLSWQPESWHEAEGLLKSIIADHPTFAPAYANLAQLSNSIHFHHAGVLRTRERHLNARAYAEQAIRLDPGDSRAHLALGWANAFLEDYDATIAHHDLARELNDSDPWTIISTALGCAFLGDSGKASALSEASFALSPSPSPSHWGYRAEIDFVAGDYAAAAEAAAHAKSILHIVGWRAAALVMAGDRTASEATLEEFFGEALGNWYGGDAPTREAAMRWFLQLSPIRETATWERLRDAIGQAGAPFIERAV